MITEKQLLAARANGSQSRGPKTSEGKSRSSRNATRHGLLSNIVVLPSESPEGFEELVDAHFTRFSPVDEIEVGMLEEMAAASWRMRRAWTIEQCMMSGAIERQPKGDDELARMSRAFGELADSQRLALLYRYETRLHHIYQRSLSTLLLTRKAAGPNQPENSPPATNLSGPEDIPPSHPEPPPPSSVGDPVARLSICKKISVAIKPFPA